jgi:hypothetical protein
LTLLKKAIIWSGSAGTISFKLANLFWCTLGCAKRTVHSSLVPWVLPSFNGGSHSQGR